MEHHLSLGGRLERHSSLDYGNAMTEQDLGALTLVAGRHVVQVRVDRSGPRSMVVSVEVDYQRAWLFEEPGWQDLAYGISGGVVYWWSARHLVIVPVEPQGDPKVIPTNEDIHLVFAVDNGWLLVCESSVRLFADFKEISRLEFGEVVTTARWDDSHLVIGNADGRDVTVTVSDDDLIASD